MRLNASLGLAGVTLVMAIVLAACTSTPPAPALTAPAAPADPYYQICVMELSAQQIAELESLSNEASDPRMQVTPTDDNDNVCVVRDLGNGNYDQNVLDEDGFPQHLDHFVVREAAIPFLSVPSFDATNALDRIIATSILLVYSNGEVVRLFAPSPDGQAGRFVQEAVVFGFVDDVVVEDADVDVLSRPRLRTRTPSITTTTPSTTRATATTNRSAPTTAPTTARPAPTVASAAPAAPTTQPPRRTTRRNG